MDKIFAAAKHLDPEVVTKLLTKKDPRWNQMFKKAANAGISAASVINFFSDKLGSGVSPEEQRSLRPEQMLSKEEEQRVTTPQRVAKKALAGAGAAIPAAGLASQMMPGAQEQEQIQETPQGITEEAQVETPQYTLENLQQEHPELFEHLISKTRQNKDPSLAATSALIRFRPNIMAVQEKIGRPFKEWFAEQIQGGGQGVPSPQEQGSNREAIMQGISQLNERLSSLGG